MNAHATFRAILISIVGFLVVQPAWCDPLPPELPDFDRPLSFTSPLLASVTHSFGISNRFGLVTNQLEIKRREDGSPDATFYYDTKLPGGFLTVNVRVGLEPERLAKVQEEISKFEKNATFSILEPFSSFFSLTTPGIQGGAATVREVKVTGPNEFAITFIVDDLFRRIYLNPYTYRSDFFSIRYEGTYRGVVRDENGTPKIGTRVYSIGSSQSGACTIYPVVAFNVATSAFGCVYPKYPRKIVAGVQRELRRIHLTKLRITGIFDDKTHAAIQEYQAKRGRVTDGIPTEELLQMLVSEKG